MFDINNIPSVTVKRVEGYWSVLMDGSVYESGYGQKSSAQQAAERLVQELNYTAQALRMTVNSIFRSH